MKKILSILLIIPLFSSAQNDSVKTQLELFNMDSKFIIQSYNRSAGTDFGRISYNIIDSSVSIQGDTAKVLWMMKNELERYVERFIAANDVLKMIKLDLLLKETKNKAFRRAVIKYRKLCER